jgi:hypothetical protein
MDYKKIANEYYIRIDKGDEILENILKICKAENIKTAHFRGIGGCDRINIQTFIQSKNDFISHEKEGVFEMVSLDGNISPDNEDIFLHAHAVFSYLENGEIKMIGGHLKEAFVKYTAEIILTPAVENVSRMIDDKTGISVWKLH